MKQAKQDIVEIAYKDCLYLVSIVEKQNDSGIMFNDRIFFLQPGKCIGYISEVKIQEPANKIGFDKPKLTVPISQLKAFVVNERELRIKVTHTDGTRRLEKDWNLRLATPLLAKKWYDRLQREKVLETAKKSSPKAEKNIAEEMRAKVEQSKTSPPRKSMQIIRSESFTFNIKPELQRVETGVGVTPAQSQSSLKKNVVQTRQIGTIMSQKAESLSSSQRRESPQKRQPSKKQLATMQGQAANRSSQKSIVTSKIIQKEPINQGITDRSFAEPAINKSVHSEPVNRNIESFKLNRKEEKPNARHQQGNAASNQQTSGRDKNANVKQQQQRLEQSGPDMLQLEQQIKSKDNMNHSEVFSRRTVSNQPIQEDEIIRPQEQIKQDVLNSSGIKSIKSLKKQEGERLAKGQLLFSQTQQVTALNNKKYITSEEFEKLNTSSPFNYFDRTSHLIKGSSHHEELPQHSHSKFESQQPQKREQIVRSPSGKKLQEGKPSTPRQSSNLKFSILEVKEEYQQCNQSQQLHQIIQDQYSSIILQEEKGEPQKQPLPWTFRYLQFGEAVFCEFKDFCLQLLQELIQDLKLPAQQQLFRKRQLKDNIIAYHIDDVQAKIAVISIEEIPSETEARLKEKVCNRKAIKLLKNEFGNYQLLYEHLQPNGKLKVPLVCLCEVNGFLGLFKALSKGTEKQIRMRDIECEIEELKARTKINSNFYHNHNRNIIQLDSQFYRSIDANASHSFNCFLLQEIEDYLLPDCLVGPNGQNLHLLRKELILKFAEDPAMQEGAARSRPISKLLERTVKEAERVSKELPKVLQQVAAEIDSLGVCFLGSQQLGQYLHGRGVNVRYLGHLFERVGTGFQKRVLMSEMAARSCKSLFRKTLQDIMLEEEVNSQSIVLKSCDFLNCVTSNSFQTAAIWKVLSSHSAAYFGVELDFNCIEKGYFLIALIENCRLRVRWDRIHPLDLFKDNLLFTDKNLLGIAPLARTYPPCHNPTYCLCAKILQEPHSEEGLSQLLDLARGSEWPWQSPSLCHQLKQYVSLFVSPYRAKEEQLGLGLYEECEEGQPTRSYFDLLLMEIKWYLKYKDRENYVQKCDQFIRVATKYFGEFHPIFSELYDLFSTYHLGCLEFEDSITFAKSSLVNILKVCGTAHDKTSECYYNLALCYIKAGKKEEAFAHMKKAKLIFENSGRSHSVPYAVISIKLALIYLNQDQPELCLTAAVSALHILESQSPSCYEDELVDCYEMITRCYEILQEKAKIQQLADRCEAQLSAITIPHNLERALKIIIYPILSQATPENASAYLDILSQLSLEPNSQHYSLAADNLKLRIAEGSLVRNLQEYLSNMQQIEAFMRESNLPAGWVGFRESFPRETVSDFLALTEELLVFLGEGFVSGSLREAL